MKLVLTGATGFVGRALLDRALANGDEVVALARQPQEPRDGVEWIAGDLANRAALTRLLADAEAVIHVAGVVNAPDRAGFEQGNVIGTLNLIEAARAAGVSRFVFVSSLSAREATLSEYGASKARAERLVMASGLDWTIVRPPAVYGPHNREMLDLFRAAKWGVVPVPAEGRLSLIHVTDLASLLLALLPGGEDITGVLFEPDDGRRGGWTHYEFARAIGAAIGRRPFVFRLSPKALHRSARIDGWVRGKGARMTPDRAAYFCHPDWVVSFGAWPPPELWQPRIETRQGLKDTAAWYRKQKWL